MAPRLEPSVCIRSVLAALDLYLHVCQQDLASSKGLRSIHRMVRASGSIDPRSYNTAGLFSASNDVDALVEVIGVSLSKENE